MHTIVSNDFQIIDDTSNQDDATISVSVDMHPTESWGTVVIDSMDLDSGQEYTLDWMVEDYSSGSPVLMIENDHIWIEGNDGVDSYSIEFHDLADTTDACILAGDTELQTVSNVCWASASTSDFDGDGVYDKDDLCPNSPSGAVVQMVVLTLMEMDLTLVMRSIVVQIQTTSRVYPAMLIMTVPVMHWMQMLMMMDT